MLEFGGVVLDLADKLGLDGITIGHFHGRLKDFAQRQGPELGEQDHQATGVARSDCRERSIARGIRTVLGFEELGGEDIIVAWLAEVDLDADTGSLGKVSLEGLLEPLWIFA